MANFANLKAAINAVIKANGQREITGEVMNQVLTAMVNSLGSNYQFAGVATPSTNPGTPDQNVFYMATQAGTYTNFSAIVLQDGISILLWDGSWSSETFFTVDSVPTSGSNNFITSGAVFDKMKLDGGAYDVTAHNNNATFADLSALLNSENLNTLIPVAVRHGGMSIKFVQSSDNKYIQVRCMAQNFTTDVTQWQGVDSEPKDGSKNLVESGGIYELEEHIFISKELSIAESGQQVILLKNKNWSKKVAIRVSSNTAGISDFRCGFYTSESSEYKRVSTSFLKYESENEITGLYVFANGAVTTDGTVTIEIVYGDAYEVQFIDSVPTPESKSLVRSGGVSQYIDKVTKETSGTLVGAELFRGTINGSGYFSANTIRVTNLFPFKTGYPIRIICSNGTRILYCYTYSDSTNPNTGGTSGTDYLVQNLTGDVTTDITVDYNPSYPNLYVTFAKTDTSQEMTIADVVNNVTVTSQNGFVYNFYNQTQGQIGEIKVNDWYQGTINGNTGLFSSNNIRVTTLKAISNPKGIHVHCKNGIVVNGVNQYSVSKNPVTGGVRNTDFIGTTPSGSRTNVVIPYNENFPNIYVTFEKTDNTQNISPSDVEGNVVISTLGSITSDISNLQTRMEDAKGAIAENQDSIADVARAYEYDVYYTKGIHLTGTIQPSSNSYPIEIKKGSVFKLSIESSSINRLEGIYFKNTGGTGVLTQYSVRSDNVYTFEPTDDIASMSVWFDSAQYKPGYTSGDVTIVIDIDDTKRILSIPDQDLNQSIFINRKDCNAISLKFNGDTSKISQITGLYFYHENESLYYKYYFSLNKWYTFGKFDKGITKIDVYTIASKVTEATSISVDIKYSDVVVSDIAYQNKGVIEAVLDNRLIVPDYYFTNNYLQNKVARINKLAQEAGDDAFIFTTDEHWNFNAQVTPAIIKYLDKNCSISKLISTGDHIQNINESGKAEINKLGFDFTSLRELSTRKPNFSSVGNHEYLSSPVNTGVLDGTNLYNWVRYAFYTDYSDVVVGNPERMYFYKDDKAKKLRYIFLNNFGYHVEAIDATKDHAIADTSYGSEQLNWFENTALNVESGYGIIIVTHWLISTRVPNQTSNETNINIPQNATAGMKDLANIIMNYSGSGEIIAVLFGHVHRDGIEVVDDVLAQNDSEHLSHNAFMSLATTCDAGFFPEATYPTEYMPYRIAGTTSECAFDFCILNRSKHRFDFVRIGYPASIRFYYNDTLEERAFVYQMQNVAVSGTKTLDHDITGTAIWNSSNTSIATVNDGVVTGVSAGIAKITVEDTDNHRAIVYMVKVG